MIIKFAFLLIFIANNILIPHTTNALPTISQNAIESSSTAKVTKLTQDKNSNNVIISLHSKKKSEDKVKVSKDKFESDIKPQKKSSESKNENTKNKLNQELEIEEHSAGSKRNKNNAHRLISKNDQSGVKKIKSKMAVGKKPRTLGDIINVSAVNQMPGIVKIDVSRKVKNLNVKIVRGRGNRPQYITFIDDPYDYYYDERSAVTETTTDATTEAETDPVEP